MCGEQEGGRVAEDGYWHTNFGFGARPLGQSLLGGRERKVSLADITAAGEAEVAATAGEGVDVASDRGERAGLDFKGLSTVGEGGFETAEGA